MPPPLAAVIVFVTSAAVLVLEIMAGRLLAPYVGVTLQTYTGIIGTVLAGISLGTWLGGRYADRADPRKILGPLLALGGALSLLSVPAVRLFGALELGAGPIGIVTLALVGFFAPAAVLSAVSPTVVKLQLSDLEQTGSVVGRLSALGTAGAIVGTFVTGFLLVAALPTQPIIFATGGALVIAGIALWRWLRPPDQGPPVREAALGVMAILMTLLLPNPCPIDSAYFCARIDVDPDRPSGRTLVLDRLRHSYVDLADSTYLEFSYAQTMSDVFAAMAPPGAPLDVLGIGGGGFSLPRYLAATRPGTFSRTLELDPALVRIAKEELGLVTGPDLVVDVGDARIGVRRQPDAAYDLVIGDAFGGQAVPWHLTTREFVEQIRRTLRPDGVYAINLIDYPPLGFAKAETATLATVFDNVAVIAPPDRLEGFGGGNFILVASDAPLPLDAIQARNTSRGDDDKVIGGAAVDAFIGSSPVLTDNYAPVDQLLTPLT